MIVKIHELDFEKDCTSYLLSENPEFAKLAIDREYAYIKMKFFQLIFYCTSLHLEHATDSIQKKTTAKSAHFLRLRIFSNLLRDNPSRVIIKLKNSLLSVP